MTLLICLPLILVIGGLTARRWFVAARQDIRSIESHRSNLHHLEHLAPGQGEGSLPGSAHVRVVGPTGGPAVPAVRAMTWGRVDGRPPAARPAWHAPREDPVPTRFERARQAARLAEADDRPRILITDEAVAGLPDPPDPEPAAAPRRPAAAAAAAVPPPPPPPAWKTPAVVLAEEPGEAAWQEPAEAGWQEPAEAGWQEPVEAGWQEPVEAVSPELVGAAWQEPVEAVSPEPEDGQPAGDERPADAVVIDDLDTGTEPSADPAPAPPAVPARAARRRDRTRPAGTGRRRRRYGVALASAAGVVVVAAGAGAAVVELHPFGPSTSHHVASAHGRSSAAPAGPAGTPAPTVAPAPTTTVPPALTATSSTPTDALYTVAPGQLQVSLSASGPCWVELRTGSPSGPVMYEGIMQAGASQSFSAGGGVWLRLGDPGGVQLRINGSAVQLPNAANPFNVTVTTA